MRLEDILPAGASDETTAYMTAALDKLDSTGTIEDCDVGGLHILGTCYEMYVQLSKEVFASGAITKDRKGNKSPNPLSIEMVKYMDKVLSYSNVFGLNVKSRDLIKSMTPAVDEDNPMREFLEAQKSKDESDEETGLDI